MRSRRAAGKEPMQSRRHSVIETGLNLIIGYLAAVASQYVIFPRFGIVVPVGSHFLIGGWFTVTSILRSYTMRRLFARWEGRR
jgi:hypothetical protein